MDHFDIAIVGGGPSGLSTALSLLRLDPTLADRMVVLEKARHPRHKLCGGGVTFTAWPSLRHLGLPIDDIDIPQVRIDRVRLKFGERAVVLEHRDAFRIVRRNLFDAALADHARRQGVELRQEAPVTAMTRDEGGFTLDTGDGARLHARLVVGADGARGFVRRQMTLPDPSRVSRLIELLTPEDRDTTPEFTEGLATFDFTPFRDRVQGYYWDFPSLEGDRALMNRGVFDARVLADAPRGDLKACLEASLRERDRSLDPKALDGHPERWFSPQGRYANPHVALVGDAAGVEPFLGEGIAAALMYGPSVAPILRDALQGGDLSLADYDRRLKASPVGRYLTFRERLARIAYARDPRLMGALLKKPIAYAAGAFLARNSRGLLA